MKEAWRPIAWKLETARIPAQGLEGIGEATASEREAIAAALEIPACERFEIRYEARPLPHGRFLLSGRVDAEVVQECVVTLDPVLNRIEEEFSVEFWPPEQIAAKSADEHAVLGADDPEPVEHKALALGRLGYEICAGALDPYPRREGVVLEGADVQENRPADETGGPFAALAGWCAKGT